MLLSGVFYDSRSKGRELKRECLSNLIREIIVDSPIRCGIFGEFLRFSYASAAFTFHNAPALQLPSAFSYSQRRLHVADKQLFALFDVPKCLDAYPCHSSAIEMPSLDIWLARVVEVRM